MRDELPHRSRGVRACRESRDAPDYTRVMAMAYDVQRLELGDVILIELEDGAGQVEAKVVRPIERTDTTVRVALRRKGVRSSSESGRSASK